MLLKYYVCTYMCACVTAVEWMGRKRQSSDIYKSAINPSKTAVIILVWNPMVIKISVQSAFALRLIAHHFI